MPNKKQKQQMRLEKQRRAKAENEAAKGAADQHDEEGLEKMAQQQTALGVHPTFPTLPVKTRKALKIVGND